MSRSPNARLFQLRYPRPTEAHPDAHQHAEVMMDPHAALVAGLRILARDGYSPYVASGIPVSMECIDRRGPVLCQG